jgi:flavodoxin
MKVLVTYLSWSGNTRRVGEAIFQQIDAEKEIKPLGEVHGVEDYDLIFVGFPIHGFGEPAEEAVEFMNKQCGGKKVALFITHGAGAESPYVAGWIESCRAAAGRTLCLGIFNCEGQIAQERIDMMLRHPDPKMNELGKLVAVASKGQPDAARLERARDFARRMVEQAKRSS